MMRKLALLYTGLLLAANAAFAGAVDPSLLKGEMGKLVTSEARALPEAGLLDLADGAQTLAAYYGKWVVLNFWATWCAPCRTEMPSLDRLQAARPDLAVVTVAVGPNPVPAIRRFLDEAAVTNLAMLRDPQGGLARPMGVLGLPVTVLINPEGQEVARLLGGAEWDSPEALAVLAALMTP
jgi:thiol-disulfide isomerase/thioredoxin